MAYCHEHWPRDMLWFHFHKLIQHWCVYSQTDIKTIDRNVWQQKPKDVSPMFRDIHAVDFLEIVSIHYKKHSLSSIQVHLNKNKDYRHKCTRCNWSPAFAGESKPSLVLQSWVPKSKSDTDSGVQSLYLWGRSSKHKFTALSYLIFLSSILFLRCLCFLRHRVQSPHHFHIPHKISK